MSYPRFPDEAVDGYHPGEEQPAMHNDEPQPIPANDELKPCPFCGGEASGENTVTEYSCRCTVCNVALHRRHHPREDGPARDEAIAHWNRRAAGAVEPASDLVERLNDVIAFWEGQASGKTTTAIIETKALREAAAALASLQQRAETLERALRNAVNLIDAMMSNDPNEPVSDAGHVALDLWKHEAEKLRSLASKS